MEWWFRRITFFSQGRSHIAIDCRKKSWGVKKMKSCAVNKKPQFTIGFSCYIELFLLQFHWFTKGEVTFFDRQVWLNKQNRINRSSTPPWPHWDWFLVPIPLISRFSWFCCFSTFLIKSPAKETKNRIKSAAIRMQPLLLQLLLLLHHLVPFFFVGNRKQQL